MSNRHFITSRPNGSTTVTIREVEPGSCAFTLTREEAWEQAYRSAFPAPRSSDPKRRVAAEIVFVGLDGMSRVVRTTQAMQDAWEILQRNQRGETPEPVVTEATEEEERLLTVIDALRAQEPNDFRDSLLSQYERKGTLSEKQIAAVERGIEKRKQWAAERAEYPDVPAGRYALRSEDDPEHITFYKVDRPEEGKWAGYTFLKVLASDEEHAVRGKAAISILRRIEADPKAAMALYGVEIGACGHCGRTLTSDWRKLGIGPICAGKMGF